MPVLKRKYKNFIVFSCAIVTAYSLFVILYGLGLYHEVVDAVFGNLPMAIDSAACFIVISLSLVLHVKYKSTFPAIVGSILAAAVLLWSLLFLIRDFTAAKVPLTFGMSPQTAFCFACLGLCFFFIRVTNKKFVFAIQALLHLVTIIAAIVIIGHLFEIPEFYEMTFIPMAIYAAISFLLLSAAASLVNARVGITGLFTGTMIGNLMARRLFLRMLIAILVIGYLRIVTHRNPFISPELAIAIHIVTYILISLLLIWLTSTQLNNIAEKRRIAEENFRIAVEAAPYALVISDRVGTIITVNECTKQLYGYKKSELIGMNVKMLIPGAYHIKYDTKKTSYFEKAEVIRLGVDKEIFARKKNGVEFPVEIMLKPVKTLTNTMMLATVIDVTERRNQQEVIRRQLIELQLKNEELEQFNYISSHDLQEPLRTMSNYIRMIEEDYPEQLNDEIRTHLSTMDSAVERMTHVVKSLLNFGKLGRKRKLAPTNCNEIVDEVKADLDMLIKASETTIVVTCRLPEFYAFKTELRQLFQNLIANAIKFQRVMHAPTSKSAARKKETSMNFR